MNKKEHDKEK